jgi:UDP-N-acetylglucosamine acyltransferase
MISGMCGIRGDVIPFGFCIGAVGRLTGLNTLGMKRRKMTRADLHAARNAYNLLFRNEGDSPFSDRLAALAASAVEPVVRQIVEFLQASGKRPILMARPRGTVEDDPIEG